MPRRRFILAYDIRDPVRLRRVHKIAKAYGWSMQYSVFVCDLDRMELIDCQSELAAEIHHGEDCIAFVDVGDPGDRGRDCFDFMGVRPTLPTSGPVIL